MAFSFYLFVSLFLLVAVVEESCGRTGGRRNRTRILKPPQPASESFKKNELLIHQSKGIDRTQFRGETGRQARSTGVIVDNGAQNMLMQLLMQQTQNNAKNCSANGNGGSDMSQLLPVLMSVMQTQRMQPAGGFS